MNHVAAQLLNVVINHPLTTAVVFFVLAALIVGSLPGRIGGVAGAVGAYAILTQVDAGMTLRVGAWAVSHILLVAGSTLAALVVSLLLTRWKTVPGGIYTRGLAGVTFGAALVPLVMFGLAAGTGRELLRANTHIPEVLGVKGAYVALGDSYSSGEGLEPYFDSSDSDQNDCHDSTRGYPRLLAEGSHLDLRYRACSGARTADLVQPRLAGAFDDVAAQVDGGALGVGPLGADSGLVTVTIGANDLHVTDILVHCFTQAHCLDARFAVASPDANDAGLPGPAPLHSWARQAIEVVGQRLEPVLAEVRRRAPNARIVVIGYPPLLPTGGRPLQFTDCDIVLSRIDRGEREGLADLEQRFDGRIYAAAAAAGVEYVDPTTVFQGHEACGHLGGMLNAIPLGPEGLDPRAFHPTAEGQRALARLVACYLADFPAPPDPFLTAADGSQVLAPAPGSPGAPLACHGG